MRVGRQMIKTKFLKYSNVNSVSSLDEPFRLLEQMLQLILFIKEKKKTTTFESSSTVSEPIHSSLTLKLSL